LILKLTGNSGTNGMVSAITVGGIICIVVCLAGDMSQDLKTGYLLGATPKKQQIGELIGSVVSALSIGGVLVLLNKAWGFGSAELSAPQATLMKIVTEGVMEGSLPWEFILVGIACTVVFELLHLPSLAIAIGIYLPLELTVPIMIGGVIRWFMDKRNKSEAKESSNGVLFSSGLIAGEGIVGIILAILTVCGVAEKIDLSAHSLGIVGGIVALAVLVAGIVTSALPKKNEA
jgi:putative OPT family oligopeptide transporter